MVSHPKSSSARGMNGAKKTNDPCDELVKEEVCAIIVDTKVGN
jgi:hypothetical protein